MSSQAALLAIINGKTEISIPVESQPLRIFYFKLGARDYVRKVTLHVNFRADRLTSGTPKHVKYNTFVTVYTVLNFFSIVNAKI